MNSSAVLALVFDARWSVAAATTADFEDDNKISAPVQRAMHAVHALQAASRRGLGPRDCAAGPAVASPDNLKLD
ncbi:hypothetical protein EVAR_19179_1 [Eumeta japonica]|uniref:Uncharacterized protein n=1 Tax=Eumeta variegata TaxID=151549 RepID=A0A4C1VNE7_EUMVA|nr:hypothetical protein EVAR_19179_1 [Eumeta japonica]